MVDGPPVDEGATRPTGLAPLYVDTLLRAHAGPAAVGFGGAIVMTLTASTLAAAEILTTWAAVVSIALELIGTAWVARRASRIDREFEAMATDL